MSWDPTIDAMLQYPSTNCGCIADFSGSIWGSSPDFKLPADEIVKIVQVAKNGTSESVTIFGQKVLVLKSGNGNLSALGSDYAIDAVVLNTCVVIAGNSKPKENPGVNRLLSTASAKIADHLRPSNY